MFKTTGSSGFRAGRGGGGAGRRVSAAVMTNTAPFHPELRRAAFLPDSRQEQTFDSNGPRLQGLEKRL